MCVGGGLKVRGGRDVWVSMRQVIGSRTTYPIIPFHTPS